MKLIELPKNDKPGEQVMEAIQKLLAESDSIDNLFLVALRKDDTVWTGWANGKDPFKMAGAVHSTLNEFEQENIERSK